MDNKIKFVLVFIGILLVVLGIVLSRKSDYNIYYDKYDDSDYHELKISDIKLTRYNEKLNSSNIAYLVGNLDIIMNENNEITNNGIIQYAMLFAENYDYRFDSNTIVIDGKKYIKVKYLNKLIKELFNLDIDVLKENLNIVDNYVELNITESLITDVFTLSLDKVLYNEKEKIYLVYISFASGNSGQDVLNDTNQNVKPVGSDFVIRYRKNTEGINTILQYYKISL